MAAPLPEGYSYCIASTAHFVCRRCGALICPDYLTDHDAMHAEITG